MSNLNKLIKSIKDKKDYQQDLKEYFESLIIKADYLSNFVEEVEDDESYESEMSIQEFIEEDFIQISQELAKNDNRYNVDLMNICMTYVKFFKKKDFFDPALIDFFISKIFDINFSDEKINNLVNDLISELSDEDIKSKHCFMFLNSFIITNAAKKLNYLKEENEQVYQIHLEELAKKINIISDVLFENKTYSIEYLVFKEIRKYNIKKDLVNLLTSNNNLFDKTSFLIEDEKNDIVKLRLFLNIDSKLKKILKLKNENYLEIYENLLLEFEKICLDLSENFFEEIKINNKVFSRVNYIFDFNDPSEKSNIIKLKHINMVIKKDNLDFFKDIVKEFDDVLMYHILGKEKNIDVAILNQFKEYILNATKELHLYSLIQNKSSIKKAKI